MSVAVARGERGGEVRHLGTVPHRPDHVRNLVERCFNKLKNARRVATRYDKTAESFLGFIDIT